jgi:hypothetical protein
MLRAGIFFYQSMVRKIKTGLIFFAEVWENFYVEIASCRVDTTVERVQHNRVNTIGIRSWWPATSLGAVVNANLFGTLAKSLPGKSSWMQILA